MPTEENGSKRPYDSSRRQQRAVLKAAIRALETEDAPVAERVPRRVRTYRKRCAKLPADRRCPGCGEVTIASKSWVVGAAIAAGSQPCCKKCWSKVLAASRPLNGNPTQSEPETEDANKRVSSAGPVRESRVDEAGL